VDNFLTYIEKYKFAILGTVLFHVVFFLSTNFVTIQRPFRIVNEVTEIEIESDEIELDEELLKQLSEQNKLNSSEEILNLANDQNDSRERSYENYSSQDIDQQVLDDAKKLESQYFEEWANTHDESELENLRRDPNESENKSNSESNGPNNTLDNEGDKAFAGQVLVSFNLKNRDAHALEVPGYTCRGSGTVVITIKVDKSGNVKDAQYNAGFSQGATSCMIDKAKRYAKRARFSYNGDGGLQTGTITYKFVGQ